MKRLKDRVTYANVLSTICLFAVLGGSAFAAVSITLPKNSVGSAQIRTGAVRSRQVKDGSLMAKDFKAGQLPAGPRGSQGPQGPQGLPGPQGSQGPVGPSEAVHATAATGPADIAVSPGYTKVLQLVLTNGSYVLDGKVVASNQSTTTASYVRCILVSDTDELADSYPIFLPPGGMQAIPLQGVRIVAGSSSTEALECRKDANVTVAIGEDPQLTAIKVGAAVS
jgi:hypothetical protein